MIYAFEEFRIDTDRFQLTGADGVIESEPQALEFLIHMIRHRGHLVTKDALHQRFWPDRIVSDAALSNLVRNARRLVGDSGDQQRLIATRHGRGFVFCAEVRELDVTAPGPDSRRQDTPGPRVEGAPAIMVLPFETVGETGDAAGLSEGITEEVMAALARTRWFPLIARNRVRTFLELPPEARHPFKELGARYLVEGGVFRDGDDVRLHLQLTDTEPALHIHVSRHDLTYRGLFDVLDEIATIVSANIHPELIEAERIKAAATQPAHRTAWQEFTLGQHLIAAPDKAANKAARTHFERALALEPGSGRIHAGLAMTHLWDHKYDWSDSAELSLGAAARDAERALALAPDDSWAWSILAICKLSLRRFDAAMADAQRAIETDPASAMAHGCHSWVLAYCGEYQAALTAFDRAMQLSPHDPRRGLWLTGRGVAQFGMGAYEEALQSARDMIALSPDHPSGHRMKCAALASLGRRDDARRAADRLIALLPNHDARQAIARQPFRDALAERYLHALTSAGLTSRAGSRPAQSKHVASVPAHAPYPVQYATTRDGIDLAWSRIGSGPVLVASVRWLGNLALDHENPFSTRIVHRLAERFTLIQFDHRGIGQSQRDIAHLSLSDMATDIDTIVRAAGLDRFALFTMAHGCPVAFEYLRNNPGRVTRLAMYGASATGWRHPEWGETTERTEAIMAVARLGWDVDDPTFRRLTAQAVLTETSGEDDTWLDSYLRQTINAQTSVRIIDALGDYDFRDMLARLDLPTLVLHGSDDVAVPIAHGRRVAELIPGADFVELASRNHVLTRRDPDWQDTLDRIMRFLDSD